MDGKARLGQWILLIIIVVTALSELALAGLSVRAGRFSCGQMGRVLLTGWLLWRAWTELGGHDGYSPRCVLLLRLSATVFGLASQRWRGGPRWWFCCSLWEGSPRPFGVEVSLAVGGSVPSCPRGGPRCRTCPLNLTLDPAGDSWRQPPAFLFGDNHASR